ncbi:MAG: GIY-YIG nuclease family protein [Candidatus Magasanikbacteria bacterium]|nr:GIY-YIG nuclease family protein [Candidatus Magasanikbacteria bacterium]
MNKYKLSQLTTEKLKYYVYFLIDPKNNKVFYVGKGKGNRINHHFLGALDDKKNESEKIEKIKEIQNNNKKNKTNCFKAGSYRNRSS